MGARFCSLYREIHYIKSRFNISRFECIYFWKCDSFFHFEIHRAAISRKLENALKYWTLWMWPFFSLCQQKKICQYIIVGLLDTKAKFLKDVHFSGTVAVNTTHKYKLVRNIYLLLVESKVSLYIRCNLQNESVSNCKKNFLDKHMH